ncbi:MAG: protein kinase [Kiritimatiellae bacterium]|nr:protein kinase [Kiritimatiellia bacterium]
MHTRPPAKKIRIVPKLMKLGPGKTIPSRISYVIDRKLGEGGVGAVYLAHNPKAPSPIPKAIKVISKNSPILAERRGRSELQKILEGEAEITALIGSNPHVVGIEEFGEMPDGSLYLVFPFIRGETYHSLNQNHIECGQLIPFELSAFVFHRISRILLQAHGHERMISHRDLSSTNIIIHTASGAPMLLDWGSANDMYDGILIGNPAFIAPEVIRDPRAIEKEGYCKADVFSLGAAIREGLLGINALAAEHYDTQRPFDYRKDVDVGRLVPLHELCVDVPKKLSQIVQECMRPNPLDRPTAFELYDMLGEQYLYTPQIGFGMTSQTMTAYMRMIEEDHPPAEVLPHDGHGTQLRKLVSSKCRRKAEREEYRTLSIKDTRLREDLDFVYGSIQRPFAEAYGEETVKAALEKPFIDFLDAEYKDKLDAYGKASRAAYRREIGEVKKASIQDLVSVLRDEIRKDEKKEGENLDRALNREVFDFIRAHIRQYV